MQKDFEKIIEEYKKLLRGDLSIEEFWNILFPFIFSFLNKQDYKNLREKIGQLEIHSLNNIFTDLLDKKQSFISQNGEQARQDGKFFVTISKRLLDKLDEILNLDEKELIFISYAREDFDYANKLYSDLKNAGLNPWLDNEKILPGQDWIKEIKEAIKNSKFFIPLFSKYSIEKRGYVQSEFRLGIDTADKIPEGHIFIIPIRIDDCQIPFDNLSKIHYQDMFPDWNKGVQRILQSMGVNTPFNPMLRDYFAIENGDITEFVSDLIVLAYPSNFYNAEKTLFKNFQNKGLPESSLCPKPDEYSIIKSSGTVKANWILVLGMVSSWHFKYKEIKKFAYQSVKIISKELSNKVEHIAITIHGIRQGLDESESFLYEIAGINDAIRETYNSSNLRKVTIVDKDLQRVQRLRLLLNTRRSNIF